MTRILGRRQGLDRLERLIDDIHNRNGFAAAAAACNGGGHIGATNGYGDERATAFATGSFR